MTRVILIKEKCELGRFMGADINNNDVGPSLDV